MPIPSGQNAPLPCTAGLAHHNRGTIAPGEMGSVPTTFAPKEKTRLSSGFLLRVAGAGIEPASGGYEPPEVPLLYPAMFLLNSKLGFAFAIPLWNSLFSTSLCFYLT